MNNLVILPIIIPLIIGVILVIFHKHIFLQRWLSAAAIIGTGVVAGLLIATVSENGIQAIQLGGWEAPFGITMAADMFTSLLIFTSSIVGLMCLLFSFRSIGKEREAHYFYPFYLFLLTGVNGAFLTGDLFNLFVCFEVMLISSYALISIGGEKRQLRESIKYVLVNVLSSFLFLIGIAYLYAVTGTLNFAHLSYRVAEVGQNGLLTTIAILFIIVFGLKAALFLFFWLPGSYTAPPTAVAAIFAALLTKVGIYAIFRMFTLIFYHEPQITHILLGVLGAITMILGSIGAVAQWEVRKILAYNVIIAVGFIISGLAAFNASALFGSIFYLLHDIVIKALIFMIGGLIVSLVGTGYLKQMSGLIRNHPALGWMFFIAALSLAGIPPLSGFVGKVFVAQGIFEAGLYWLGAIGLMASLFILYSIMKIFMNGFWGETNLSLDEEKGTTKGLLLPIVMLTAVTVGMGLGAELFTGFIEQATEELLNPHYYIEAVFGSDGPSS